MTVWSCCFSTVIRRCKICFKEVEGSSQCQGARKTCSGWSSPGMIVNDTFPAWSKNFRDDTDNRRGGCIYNWRLICEWAPINQPTVQPLQLTWWQLCSSRGLLIYCIVRRISSSCSPPSNGNSKVRYKLQLRCRYDTRIRDGVFTCTQKPTEGPA